MEKLVARNAAPWPRSGGIERSRSAEDGVPASPHYDDQVQLFAKEEMRDTLMTEAQVREHLSVEYRPGDFKDAWYAHAK